MTLQKRNLFFIISLSLIALVGILVHLNSAHNPAEGQDIYYIWLEGKRILAGENPYARVLLSNMRENDKYATYFPLFYWLAALTQWLGFREYTDWLALWRPIFLMFNLGIAAIVYYALHRHRMTTLGLFAALFWLFNRWTLYITEVAHIDFISIFFMLTSLLLLPRRKYAAYVLFSISLAIKQIAIFLVPIYLIYAWNTSENKIKAIGIALVIILSVPLITSLPFLIGNAEGFLKSILFSATRNAASHILDAPSLDVYLGDIFPDLVGIKAKIPMLLLLFLVYLSALQQQIGVLTSALLTMFTFINFNSVLFIQYFAWVMPLIPLSVCDFKKG